MTKNNLYWTAYGIPKNAYDDGFLHKYKAVNGTELSIDSIAELKLFTYTDGRKTFIVLSEVGVSISSGSDLKEAADKLNKSISDYGSGLFLNKVRNKMESLPLIPNQPPLFENEIKELNIAVSMKTGEENLSHTKWFKSFENKTAQPV